MSRTLSFPYYKSINVGLFFGVNKDSVLAYTLNAPLSFLRLPLEIITYIRMYRAFTLYSDTRIA